MDPLIRFKWIRGSVLRWCGSLPLGYTISLKLNNYFLSWCVECDDPFTWKYIEADLNIKFIFPPSFVILLNPGEAEFFQGGGVSPSLLCFLFISDQALVKVIVLEHHVFIVLSSFSDPGHDPVWSVSFGWIRIRIMNPWFGSGLPNRSRDGLTYKSTKIIQYYF